MPTVAPDDLHALFAPRALPDPYPLYRRARRHGEVFMLPGAGGAFVFGHAETAALLRDPRVSAERLEDVGITSSEALKLLFPMMLFHDGASHARLRGLASRAFTPQAVAETREFLEGIVDGLLGQAARQGRLDAVEDLAVPLPVAVITEMLGLRGDDRELFRTWSHSIAALLDGSSLTEEAWPAIEADAGAMRRYFRGVADELRASPRPGLLSALAQAEAAGDRLSNDELLANAVLLLVAGHETTTNLISGGLLALSQFPGQWASLVEQPEITPGAVEELLRFVSPVQGTGRVVKADLQVGEVHLPAGTPLYLFLGAANRDERRFASPDELDLTREAARAHLAFAVGAHYCLGASLARLEAQVVFRRLADRFPGLQVPEQKLEYRPNFVLRGLRRLEVRLG